MRRILFDPKLLATFAIILALLVAVALPARLRCLGDCVLTKMLYCIETSDADCILAAATKRFLDPTLPREREEFGEQDLAKAVVESQKVDQVLKLIRSALVEGASIEVKQRATALLQEITYQLDDTSRHTLIEPFQEKVKRQLGLSLRHETKRPIDANDDMDNYYLQHGESKASQYILLSLNGALDHPVRYYFSGIYPAITLNRAVPSDTACAAMGTPDLIGLRLTPRALEDRTAFLESVRQGGLVSIDTLLANQGPAVQLVRLSAIPRETLLAYEDLAPLLERIRRTLSQRVANLSKTVFELRGYEWRAAAVVPHLDPTVGELKLNILLYANWVSLALETVATERAFAAAATLFELLIQADKTARPHEYLPLLEARTPSYFLREVLPALSYVLAKRGFHGLPLAYAASLGLDRVTLKAAMVACVFHGLASSGRYVEAVDLLLRLPPITGGLITRKQDPDVACPSNLVFGTTCEVLSAFDKSDQEEVLGLGRSLTSLDRQRLSRDSAFYFEMLIERLCHRLAGDRSVTGRWPEVLAYLSAQLGPSAGQLADFVKRATLREFQGASPTGQQLSRVFGRAGNGTALYYAKARFDVELLKERGEPKQVLMLALLAGRSDEFQSPTDDEPLIQGLVSNLLHSEQADWLLALVHSKRSEIGQSLSLSNATMTFLVQQLVSSGRLSAAIAMQVEELGYSGGADERRLIIASELVKRRMIPELISLVADSKDYGSNPVKLSIRLLPTYSQLMSR